MADKNIFALYSTKEGWEQAQIDIAMSIYESFFNEPVITGKELAEKIGPILKKYTSFGATDTTSREALDTYLVDVFYKSYTFIDEFFDCLRVLIK